MIINVIEPDDYYDGSIEIQLITEEVNETIIIGSGESEDMNLARDLSDALTIPKLLKAAYNAGLNKEILEINNIIPEEDE